jgi:hypothetical protein
MVGGGATAGIALSVRNLRKDPQLAWYNRQENPFPWLHVTQGENLKLVAASRKFDENNKEVKPTFS